MSSSYSVSTSESGSFATNPTLHQQGSRHATAGAAAGGAGAVHVDAAATAASTRSDATPKKAAQSSKSANTTQESPSMTIRRVPVDYSKRMEDQKARSNALERYKMLVKGNRLVPSEGEVSPSPVKVKRTEFGDDALTPNASTRRSGHQLQLAYSANRDGSTLSRTVVSDDSDVEEEEDAAGATTRFSQNRKSADPRPPRSLSRRQQEQMAERRARSSSSPVSVSVSVERPAYPHSAKASRQRSEPSTAAAATAAAAPVVLPGLNLAQTIPHFQQQQSASAMDADTEPYSISAADNEEGEDDGIDYVAPELTQPFGSSKQLRPRSTIRPGYEPVTARGRSSFQRTASGSGEPHQQQPRSQVHGHSSITRSHADVSPSGPSTPRRKSAAKPQGPAAEERPVVARLFPDKEGEQRADGADSTAAAAAASDTHRDGAAKQKPREAGDVVPLPGSKTAFWLRPSSAMYEMTTSVAAKRKDHSEPEGFQRTNSSSHTSRSFHYTPSGTTASNCGTPRGTPRGRASNAAAEKKPRFSTHVTAADRKLYEENGAAAAATKASTAPSTYDAIFTSSSNNRHSAVQRGSTQRSQKAAGAAALDRTVSSVGSGSTPRGTPRGAPPRNSSQHRVAPQRVESLRSPQESRPSTYSRLSSNQPISPSEEQPAEVGRVSTRQQGALTKHCARVAAGVTVLRADDAVSSAPSDDAAAKKAKRKTTASPAPGQPKKRLSTAAPAQGAARPSREITQPSRAVAANVEQQQPQQRASSPDVHKRLEYEIADEPVPRTTVPRSSKRILAPADDGEAAGAAAIAPVESPHTTIHGRRAGEDDTPSKSRRREHDVVASPPRDDDFHEAPHSPQLHPQHHHHQHRHPRPASPNARDAARTAEARFAAQDAAMEQEKEQARALQTRDALESCRLARQARIEAARTSHAVGATAVAPGTSVSTNEVVAAMLQGIVQQTRHTLPCFLCGDQQSTSGYRVHVGLCRPKTEGLLREYFTTVAGLPGIPAAVTERIERVAALEVPLSTSEPAIRDAFAKDCYQCVKSTLVPCRKCGTYLRVHDVKEHEMLCGREYYRNSRAAERVRSTVDRIERGAQE